MVFQLNIDLRSLAAFRICFGLYLLWDIYSRLSLGSIDLAWYTSGEPTSILDEQDTPHRSPAHRVWFFRGRSSVQCFLFAATAFLAILYTIGHPHCPKLVLWLMVVAQQCRNMHVHDGSDNFGRQLLLWSCFLPIDAVWSWKGYLRPSRKSVVVSTLAMYGFCTQILLMYFGTVCHRTLDLYTWKNLRYSEWLPPQLTAVHYALSGSFAVRDNSINRFIRQHAMVSRSMRMMAMIVETLAPIGCAFGWPALRQSCALLLVALHCGLYISLRLPHWQLLTILTHATVWIPSASWNKWFPDCTKEEKHTITRYRRSQPSMAATLFQTFLFTYMIFNFCGERKWIPKYDNGDIGEALRLSQYWVMYSKVDHAAYFASVTFDNQHAIPIGNFPARWERALHQWAGDRDRDRVKRFLIALCRGWKHPIAHTIRWDVSQHRILPPNRNRRFEERSSNSTVTIQCGQVMS